MWGRFRDAFWSLLQPSWDSRARQLERQLRELLMEVTAMLDKLQHAAWRETKRRTRALDSQLALDPEPTPQTTKPGTHRGAIAARVRATLGAHREPHNEPTDTSRAAEG